MRIEADCAHGFVGSIHAPGQPAGRHHSSSMLVLLPENLYSPSHQNGHFESVDGLRLGVLVLFRCPTSDRFLRKYRKELVPAASPQKLRKARRRRKSIARLAVCETKGADFKGGILAGVCPVWL